MKKMKKLASLLVALVMTLVMAMPVFATAVAPTPGNNPENTPANSGNFTIELTAPDDGNAAQYSYDAYQIFSGDLADDQAGKITLSNIKWGSGVDETKLETALAGTSFEGKDAKTIAETLSGKAFDSSEAKEFASAIAKALSTTSTTKSQPKTEGEGEAAKVVGYTISGLAAGYYLVKSDNVPNVDGAATRYMMEVVGNVTATPKSDVPTSDKKIVEGNDRVDVNDAAIGDTVTYEITGTLPSNFADYKSYHYIFKDTLSKGLTVDLVDPSVDYASGAKKIAAKVEIVNGNQRTDVTKYFYMGAKENDDKTTSIVIGMENIKDLTVAPVSATLTKDSSIVVTYTAVVNSDAEIGKLPNTNDVVLDFSNDPNYEGDGPTTPPENPDEPKLVDPSGETPKVTVETYVTELSILKVDAEGKPLAGVEFELIGENGEKITLVEGEKFVLDENGDYWKLKNGSYTTMAPITETTEAVEANVDKYDMEAGKFKLTKVLKTTTTSTGKTSVKGTVDPVTGRVTFTGLGAGDYTLKESKTPAGYNTISDIEFKISFDSTKKEFSSNNAEISLGTNNTLETTIVNNKGSLLPSTGGIGTTIFYVVGTILVLGAGILLVTKRRMKAQ